jgi:hypothetical protein
VTTGAIERVPGYRLLAAKLTRFARAALTALWTRIQESVGNLSTVPMMPNVRVDRAPRSEATREPNSEAVWRSGRTRGWATPRTVRVVSSPPFAAHAWRCSLPVKPAGGRARSRGEQDTPRRGRLLVRDALCRMRRPRHARATGALLPRAAIVAGRCAVPPSLLWGRHVEGVDQAQRWGALGRCQDRPALRTPAPATSRTRWRDSTAGRAAHAAEQARSHVARKLATECEASLSGEACKAKTPAGAECGGRLSR